MYVTETWAEAVQRLQREIAERQMQLQFLLCGDPSKSITTQAVLDTVSPDIGNDLNRPQNT